MLTCEVPTVLLYFTHALVPKRPRRPQLSLQGDDVPGVDVMITACGEDHDLIMNVVRAACETNWPNDRLHVILLDDGKSEELRKSMQRLQETYPWAHYTSRKAPEVPDYKAGNLNHGLEYSAGLSIDPFPFVAGLDVDMIVQPHWLRAMMPHLLKDPGLGMACPRQVLFVCPCPHHYLTYASALLQHSQE